MYAHPWDAHHANTKAGTIVNEYHVQLLVNIYSKTWLVWAGHGIIKDILSLPK